MLGNKKFDEILNYMGNYHQIREKIEVDSKFHDKIIEKINSKFSKEYSETSTLDGIKGIIDEDNWVLVRKSNTENSIRISAESSNKEKCEKIIKHTLELVKERYEQVK
jgi:phosphomannomutase